MGRRKPKRRRHAGKSSEYNLVLTAPPNESIQCLGVVTTISEGRNDLPSTDSGWAGTVFDDDGA